MEDFRVVLIVLARNDELFFYGFHGIEQFVMKELFAHIIPVIFGGVQRWAPGRELYKHHVAGNMKNSLAVTRGAIADYKNKKIFINI